MSCYAWGHGTTTLPSGQATVLRKVLTAAAESRITALGADAEKGWNHLKKLTPAKRRDLRVWDQSCPLDALDGEAVWLLQRYDDKTRKTRVGASDTEAGPRVRRHPPQEHRRLHVDGLPLR